jgi:hypothetical protein
MMRSRRRREKGKMRRGEGGEEEKVRNDRCCIL